jgi:hypothetical protein
MLKKNNNINELKDTCNNIKQKTKLKNFNIFFFKYFTK